MEKSAIEAIKSDKVTFIQVKSINVTSGFNLRKLKKSDRWRWYTENSKPNIKNLISPLLICMKWKSSTISQNCSFRMGFNLFCHASQAAKGPGAVEAWIQNNTSQWGKIRLMNDNVICNETRLTPTDIGYVFIILWEV